MSTKFRAKKKKKKQAQLIIEVDEVVNMFWGRQEQLSSTSQLYRYWTGRCRRRSGALTETGSLYWRDCKIINLTWKACQNSLGRGNSNLKTSVVLLKAMWNEDLVGLRTELRPWGLKTSRQKKEDSPALPSGLSEICWWKKRTDQTKITRKILHLKKCSWSQNDDDTWLKLQLLSD